MEKVSDIIPFFKSNLNQIGDEKEIISWAYLSIKHVLGFNRSECIVYKDQKLSKSFQFETRNLCTPPDPSQPDLTPRDENTYSPRSDHARSSPADYVHKSCQND